VNPIDQNSGLKTLLQLAKRNLVEESKSYNSLKERLDAFKKTLEREMAFNLIYPYSQKQLTICEEECLELEKILRRVKIIMDEMESADSEAPFVNFFVVENTLKSVEERLCTLENTQWCPLPPENFSVYGEVFSSHQKGKVIFTMIVSSFTKIKVWCFLTIKNISVQNHQ
jgi:hypothetical protein